MSLDGRRVVLTGGAGGLGDLLRRRLQKLGARVLVIDRVIGAGSTDHFQGDLSTAEGIDAVAAEIASGPCDILFNLAGIQHFGPLEGQPPAHLVASYMVNLVAPARLSQAVIPMMKARGGGQIVNVGSIFGSINFAHFATYSSAKAGLRGLSQAMRRELVGSGIGITYIAPRAVRTPLNSAKVLEFARLTKMNMDEPDAIADRIMQAVLQRKSEAYFGYPESLFVRVNALLPGLVDRALSANDRKAAQLFSA